MDEKKILIVDDEVTILTMLSDILSTEGYTVRTAGNAKEALNVVRQEGIMVMFIDLNLPGKNGLELGDEIHKQRVAIMYALTGDPHFFGLMNCRVAGFDDLFLKPIPIDTILKAAAHAFEKIERWEAFEFDLP